MYVIKKPASDLNPTPTYVQLNEVTGKINFTEDISKSSGWFLRVAVQDWLDANYWIRDLGYIIAEK